MYCQINELEISESKIITSKLENKNGISEFEKKKNAIVNIFKNPITIMNT